MLVPFDTLPDTARIWIYQSSKPLTGAQVAHSKQVTESFIQNWTAHEAGLKGGVQILFNRFIIIGVDENYNDASGCSIDKKVNFMKQLGADLETDFFNRMQVAFIANETLQLAGMHEIAGLIKSGKLSDETLMFNNLVTKKGDLTEYWQIPVRNSWMQQLIHS